MSMCEMGRFRRPRACHVSNLQEQRGGAIPTPSRTPSKPFVIRVHNRSKTFPTPRKFVYFNSTGLHASIRPQQTPAPGSSPPEPGRKTKGCVRMPNTFARIRGRLSLACLLLDMPAALCGSLGARGAQVNPDAKPKTASLYAKYLRAGTWAASACVSTSGYDSCAMWILGRRGRPI